MEAAVITRGFVVSNIIDVELLTFSYDNLVKNTFNIKVGRRQYIAGIIVGEEQKYLILT